MIRIRRDLILFSEGSCALKDPTIIQLGKKNSLIDLDAYFVLIGEVVERRLLLQYIEHMFKSNLDGLADLDGRV